MLHRCNRLRQPPESAADRNGFVLSRPTQGHLGSPGWDGTCFIRHNPDGIINLFLIGKPIGFFQIEKQILHSVSFRAVLSL